MAPTMPRFVVAVFISMCATVMSASVGGMPIAISVPVSAIATAAFAVPVGVAEFVTTVSRVIFVVSSSVHRTE